MRYTSSDPDHVIANNSGFRGRHYWVQPPRLRDLVRQSLSPMGCLRPRGHDTAAALGWMLPSAMHSARMQLGEQPALRQACFCNVESSMAVLKQIIDREIASRRLILGLPARVAAIACDWRPEVQRVAKQAQELKTEQQKTLEPSQVSSVCHAWPCQSFRRASR